MAKVRALQTGDALKAEQFLKEQGMAVPAGALPGFLDLNPGLSQAAFQDDGSIIGIVLCSFDGLQGYLRKLSVAAGEQKRGYGRQLIAAALSALQKTGCSRATIHCHPYLAEWYEKQGFVKVEGLTFSKTLKPEPDKNCD